MTETVCVTVGMLRRIEHCCDGLCPVCEASIFTELGREETHELWCDIGQVLRLRERLNGWTPKVGDLVRLKAMPEAGTWKVLEINEGSLGMKAWLVSTDNARREMQRYLGELMPAEGE